MAAMATPFKTCDETDSDHGVTAENRERNAGAGSDAKGASAAAGTLGAAIQAESSRGSVAGGAALALSRAFDFTRSLASSGGGSVDGTAGTRSR